VFNKHSFPTLTNSILWGDIGGEIYNGGDGNATVRYSDVQGGYSGTGNISLDPRLGALGNHGGLTQTIALGPGSPAIDAGNNAFIPAGVTTDQRGFARISGAAVDLGAYEVQLPAVSPAVLPDGAYGTAYGQALTATEGPGGAGGPYTLAVTAGSLPAGLSLALGGALTGTPSAAGQFSFTVTASDRGGYTGHRSYTLTIDPAAPALSVTDAGGTHSGFVNGEGPGVLGGALAFAPAAPGALAPGTYALTPGGLTSGDYAVTFVSGTLTVLSYGQATNTLQSQVDAAGLDLGTQNKLDTQLQEAVAYFNAGDTADGVSRLGAFVNDVKAQSGKKISVDLADAWVAYAQRIITATA